MENIIAWRYGAKLGRFVQKVLSNFYWRFPSLRKRKYNKINADPNKKIVFIIEFLKGFNCNRTVSFVSCNYCKDKNVGIDYQSGKHGWYYEGYHYWSCPKCQKEKNNGM